MYCVLTTILVLIDFNEFILLIDIVQILVSSWHCFWCICDSTGSVFNLTVSVSCIGYTMFLQISISIEQNLVSDLH